MICFGSYKEHDIDADPIVCLPCGHIYSISTLDGHLAFSELYTKDAGSEMWTGLKSLRDARVDEKPKCCPECRAGIHSIRRYGRLLRLCELRSLERKHLMSIDQALDVLARPGNEGSIKKLKEVLKTIERSPMQMVFEACKASNQVEVPPPPARPLIRALQLLGRAYEDKVKVKSDESFTLAKAAYERAIAVALTSVSIRSGAILRISLASLLFKWDEANNSVRGEAFEHLDWVIENAKTFADLVSRAQEIKHEFVEGRHKKALAKVIAAMEIVDGYNYGGSWSSHWYQCPNGHPYFIGECGGAMQVSRCPDCGARVGGTSHMLVSTNREAVDFIDDIRRAGR